MTTTVASVINNRAARDVLIYEHPKTIQFLKIAGIALGGALIAKVFLKTPDLSNRRIVCLGAAELVYALLFRKISGALLHSNLPSYHNMRAHVYSEGEYKGSSLYYRGDLPILSLKSDNAFEAGEAQGYLCGNAILQISSRFPVDPEYLECQMFKDFKSTIPKENLLEIEGLVNGYNKWVDEQSFWKKAKPLTIDQCIYFHTIPEQEHISSRAFKIHRQGFQEKWARDHFEDYGPNDSPNGCSVFMEKDPEKGIIVARNLDQPSRGVLGTYTLLIKRNHMSNKNSTLEIGYPSITGTLTGINSNGLILAINTADARPPDDPLKNLPICLYTRYLLETCSSVLEVTAATEKSSPSNPFHLSVADKTTAISIHFFQNTHRKVYETALKDCIQPLISYLTQKPRPLHYTRELEDGKCLYTLNGRYSRGIEGHDAFRNDKIKPFLENRNNLPLEKVLELPRVCDENTIQKIVFDNSGVHIAFDNAYAGRLPMQTISFEEIN